MCGEGTEPRLVTLDQGVVHFKGVEVRVLKAQGRRPVESGIELVHSVSTVRGRGYPIANRQNRLDLLRTTPKPSPRIECMTILTPVTSPFAGKPSA